MERKKALPIRLKIEMAEKIGEVIQCLHRGRFSMQNQLLGEIKSRSLHLEDPIQQDVLMFSEAVQFQAGYDPWHLVTPTVEKMADQLVEALGFVPPSGR